MEVNYCLVSEAAQTIQFFADWYRLAPCDRLEFSRRLQRERDQALAEVDRLKTLVAMQPPIVESLIEILG